MSQKLRRTKIVTTLGPATDKEGVLEDLIKAGANVVRMNFSHGTAEEHIIRANNVRAIAKKLNIHVAILGDLQGPKIRISTFKEGKIILKVGDDFVLDSELPKGQGDQTQVGLDYKNLPRDLTAGDILLLDDGRVQLLVQRIEGSRIYTQVIIAGPLSNNKGINKKGGGLSAEALTDKDKEDMKTAAAINVDFLAISFPRNGDDMRYARKLAEELGLKAQLVAKVERAETVSSIENIDEIILASDVVMVARGDLGVEIGDAELVGVQKTLISRARKLDRIVITATQMMESMILNPMPTRAEVMDVANAVIDGTDAVMLSAETAAGNYPIETVKMMANICIGAEKMPNTQISKYRSDRMFETTEETIAMSIMFAANHLKNVKAMVSLTSSGRTPLMMSRLSSGLPIFAMSRNLATLNKAVLYRGVTPIHFDYNTDNPIAQSEEALKCLKAMGHLKSGDLVILTQGTKTDHKGTTDLMRVMTV